MQMGTGAVAGGAHNADLLACHHPLPALHVQTLHMRIDSAQHVPVVAEIVFDQDRQSIRIGRILFPFQQTKPCPGHDARSGGDDRRVAVSGNVDSRMGQGFPFRNRTVAIIPFRPVNFIRRDWPGEEEMVVGS